MENISETKKPSRRDLVYFRQNQRNEVFQAVVAHFAKAAEERGLTKKELAGMVGKDPAQITRWLGGPKNWELDTISDLLLAMNARMVHKIVPLCAEDNTFNIAPLKKMSANNGVTATAGDILHTAIVKLEQSHG